MYKIVCYKENKTVIEKSKFFSFLFECYSREEQSKILKDIKRKNLSATHICYASSIYNGREVEYISTDDREPSGTAGLQILQAIKENELVNTLCVVVRYFGGIKLGVPGLSKAYKEAATSVIINNKTPVVLKEKCTINCDYNKFNALKAFCEKKNIKIDNMLCSSDISFDCFLSQKEQEEIKNFTKNINVEKNKNYY